MQTKQTKSGIQFGWFDDRRFAPALRRQVSRRVLLLPGQGCVPWLRTCGDCCVFCRLPAGTRYAVLGKGQEDRFESWRVAVEDYCEMIDTALDGSDGVDSLTVFNGGSFLTDQEIPADARRHLYRAFAAHPTATELMIESRPEFVRDEVLDEAERLIGGKHLMIAIGLESTDDKVRNELLKKYIGRRSFLDALERLKERGHRSLVYTFLGAPGLTEEEAYCDALATLEALAEMRVDEMALSCAFVPEGGPLEKLYQAGEFRPPWLWTIVRLSSELLATTQTTLPPEGQRKIVLRWFDALRSGRRVEMADVRFWIDLLKA